MSHKKTSKEIAQWVIDNRYPKGENDKVSDFEMYNEIVECIEKLISVNGSYKYLSTDPGTYKNQMCGYDGTCTDKKTLYICEKEFGECSDKIKSHCCPECGCMEYLNKNLISDGYRMCRDCHQDWWVDIKYDSPYCT